MQVYSSLARQLELVEDGLGFAFIRRTPKEEHGRIHPALPYQRGQSLSQGDLRGVERRGNDRFRRRCRWFRNRGLGFRPGRSRLTLLPASESGLNGFMHDLRIILPKPDISLGGDL